MAEPRFRKDGRLHRVRGHRHRAEAGAGQLPLAPGGHRRRGVSALAGVHRLPGAEPTSWCGPMQRITCADGAVRAPIRRTQPRVSSSRAAATRSAAPRPSSTRMQADLRAALKSRARLAALGEAVAKINHDLKNMLTSAQLASERLAASKDPKVSQALPAPGARPGPRREAGRRRAGLRQDPGGRARDRRSSQLAEALKEAAAEAAPGGPGREAGLQGGRRRPGDRRPDQLHRILVSLLRNARQAHRAPGGPRRRRPGRGLHGGRAAARA